MTSRRRRRIDRVVQSWILRLWAGGRRLLKYELLESWRRLLASAWQLVMFSICEIVSLITWAWKRRRRTLCLFAPLLPSDLSAPVRAVNCYELITTLRVRLRRKNEARVRWASALLPSRLMDDASCRVTDLSCPQADSRLASWMMAASFPTLYRPPLTYIFCLHCFLHCSNNFWLS